LVRRCATAAQRGASGRCRAAAGPLPGRAGQKGHGRGACRGARRIRSGGLDRLGGRGRLAPL